MAGANMVEQVRDGMHVRSADGRRIGKVRLVHTRETEVYVEVAPKASLRFWRVEPKHLFVPANAVAEVEGRQVILNMDANAARSCTRRPPWIPAFIVDPNRTLGSSGTG